MCMYMYIQLSIRIDLSSGSRISMYMYDYTVSSMSILCLWNIQLTFDWVGIEPHGIYLTLATVSTYRYFKIQHEVITILGTARSTRIDFCMCVYMVHVHVHV